MNKALSLNRRGWAKVWRFSILAMLLLPALLLTPGESFAVNPATPLEQSGLIPDWQENFTNGSIQRMQYAWFQGSATAVASFVQPGAVFLGRAGGCGSLPSPCEAEQQINNFKMAGGEPLPLTFEFDVYSPYTGRGRISARPSRSGDMVTILLGLSPSGRTEVKVGQDNQFLGPPGQTLWNEATGPSYNFGWTHIVISYQQYDNAGALWAHFVVAINEEEWQLDRPSELTPGTFPDWASEWAGDSGADGWSIEHTSDIETFGRYIANLRFYSEFNTAAQLDARLPVGTVDSYLAALPNPTTYGGLKKEFKDPTDPFQPTTPTRPFAKAYATQVGPSTSKTFDFDGSLSSDLDKLTSYTWNFGDGTPTGSGRFPSHTYASAGTYPVTLTVSNGSSTDEHTIQVTIAGTPPPMPFKLFLPSLMK